MPFIGNQPAKVPLTSADITDGIIVNADINANAAIESSKLSITSPLSITGNSTAGSEIRLPEDTDNGSNYVALKAANSIASNLTFTLPSADGSANQALITNGSGSLSFATVGATAGQVIQVVSATTNTEVERSTSTSTYFKTALTANITCSATSSKVLILITACGSQRTQYAYLKGNITKTVGGSDSELYSTGQAMVGTDIGSDLSGTLSIAYLDSPSTTSQLTYTLSTKASNTYRIFRDDIQASIILLEIKG